MKTKGAILAVLPMLAWAGSAPAPTRTAPAARTARAVAFRPFFLASYQRFAAQKTFQAAFGGTAQPFFGGGVDIAFRHGIFADFTVSRFSKDGQRAFLFNGQSYRLGIPLRATEIPIEVSAGYRFRAWRRIRPYAGGGFGSYGYKETSKFSTFWENVSVRHTGYLLVGGVEVRVNSWVGIALDVQWTYVPGILGTGGLSGNTGSGGGSENDLGGIAPRVRLIIGH